MYKKLGFLLLASCLSMNATAYTGYGICKFGKETLNDAKCYGPTTLAETTVKGEVNVTGPLSASNSTMMDSVHVTGIAHMSHSDVKGNTKITGPLAVDHSKFSGNLDITSDKVRMSASTVTGSITVESKHNAPKIELLCGTNITGDVNFVGIAGVIAKSPDSKIGGKVTNGTVTVVQNGKC